MKKLSVLFVLVAFVGLTGCSTMKGLGDDIGTVGDWITKGSQKVEQAGK